VILKGGPHAKAVLANASPKLVRAISHMVMHGHAQGLIPHAHAQKHSAKIAKLRPGTSAATKAKTVQGGGFLGFLGPVLGGLASAIFGHH